MLIIPHLSRISASFNKRMLIRMVHQMLANFESKFSAAWGNVDISAIERNSHLQVFHDYHCGAVARLVGPGNDSRNNPSSIPHVKAGSAFV